MASSWMRSAGAVLGGFFATAVLSVGTDAVLHATGVFPPVGERMSDALFGLAALYRAAYTVAGGALTAKLAPDRPMGHAVVLMVLGLLGGAAGAVVSWQHPELGPRWYALSIPISAVPCIWAGARLGMRRGA